MSGANVPHTGSQRPPYTTYIPHTGKEHGLDLVGRIRALSPAPILVLTAYGSEEVAVRALRAGVSDYLRKPFNLEDLKTSLSRLIR